MTPLSDDVPEGGRLTVGSLFSGIGGLDLGLERAGMEVRWQCEIDPYCRKVLAKHWPNVPCYEDVRELPDNVEQPDLICGGYPCQPFSLAGERGGSDDPRHLWPDFARVLGVLRPEWALLENVPGHLSLGFGEVLGDLADLGYDAEWSCIPAAAVGAPHLRWRVFVVAHANSTQRVTNPDAGNGRTLSTEGVGGIIHGSRGGEDVAHANEIGRRRGSGIFGERRRGQSENGGWWSIEPDVGRVAHGVPSRVDRLRALGNAVVPQVAELIGRRIMDSRAPQSRGAS